MITFENTEVCGWNHAIRGMRNPLNSWDKKDSNYMPVQFPPWNDFEMQYVIGPNDHDLALRLARAGSDHRKFMRMIVVYADITAPLYWWKEYDTYKVGTVANSCSTMHKIHDKEFTMDDFSTDQLVSPSTDLMQRQIIPALNFCRQKYLETKEKQWWWQLIQLLPTSYNQRRTVLLNYEVLRNIYHARRNHKLDEWHDFCAWIETLPYHELITGGDTLPCTTLT